MTVSVIYVVQIFCQRAVVLTMTSEDNEQNEAPNIDAGIFLAHEVAPLSKTTFLTIPSCVGLNTAQLSVPLIYLRRYLSGTAAGLLSNSMCFNYKRRPYTITT